MEPTTRYEVVTLANKYGLARALEWDNQVGDDNEFATIAEAQEAIADLRTCGYDWEIGIYAVREIGESTPESGTISHPRVDLPLGWLSTAELAGVAAGRAYIIDRLGEDAPYASASSVARYETCQPADPKCYADVYSDDSVYIHSNADDEVWYDLDEYLTNYDLRPEGDTIVAIV